MQAYPIFLLPKGEIMMTAKIDGDKILVLEKTIFPSNKTYSISETGLAACLDNEKKIIIYGYLKEDGNMEGLVILPFPSMISPITICILKNQFLLGGDKDVFGGNYSDKLMAKYSILQNKFTIVEMPLEINETDISSCINDILFDYNKVIVVCNLNDQNYLLEYDIKNNDFSHLTDNHILPQYSSLKYIIKVTFNNSFVALLTSCFSTKTGDRFINIFRKGNYKGYASLYQCNRNYNPGDWSDILLLPDHNVLFVLSHKDGIGICFIDDSMISDNRHYYSYSIRFTNKWKKKVIKILLPPQINDKILLIFEEEYDNNLLYSFALESIEEILKQYNVSDEDYFNTSHSVNIEPDEKSLNQYNESESDDDDLYNDFSSSDRYYDGGNSGYCSACNESPCMCSDKDK